MIMFLLFGFYSLLAQVLLLREISQAFTAHELSLAAALAAWLFWTAAGIRLGAGRAGNKPAFGAASLFFAALVPADLLLVEYSPALLPALSQPGLFTMLAGSLLLAAPAGLANGFAAARGLQGRPARFYAAEAAGAALAGLFTIVYFHNFPGLSAAAALGAPALLLGLAYAAHKPLRPARLGPAAALFTVFCLAYLAEPFCRRLQPPAPRPGPVIQTEGSRLALAGPGNRYVYEDGRLLHAPEDTAPEEFVHIPLLAARNPARVLLSGSAAFFLLPEVLKHGGVAVEIAEPDRFKAKTLAALTDAGKKTYSLLNEDPRLIKGRAAGYDLIFQSASAPENAALNRFFTVEYFRLAAALLKPGGMLVFQLPFAENYVPKETVYAAACVLASARSSFGHVELIPGKRLTVLASQERPALEPPALAAQYARRGIKNRTVVPSALPYMLDPYRRAWAENELARVKKPPLNTDLNPLAYFRFWRAWLSMVAAPSALLGLFCLAGAALLAAARLRGIIKFTPDNLTGEAFFMGFWALALETALLLAFQAKTGRLAPELGLLFAVFMAGSSAGAWLGGKGGPGPGAAEVAAAAAAVACAAWPEYFAAGPALWGMICCGGFITGFFFARAAGNIPCDVYALDLIGGAAGGFVTAAFAAPISGIRGALALAGLAGAAALAGRALGRKRGVNPRKNAGGN